MSNDRLSYLYHSFISKTASADELQELKGYFNDAIYKDTILNLMDDTWNAPQNDLLDIAPDRAEYIYNRLIQQRPKVRSLHAWRWSAAAAILLVALGYLNYYLGTSKPKEILVNKLVAKDIPSGSDKAILRLTGGRTIALNEVKNGRTLIVKGAFIHKNADGQVIYKSDNSRDKEVYMNTIEVPKGGEFQVYLPDGTHVYLNSESSLSYPTRFASTERKVSLSGEAYFEVAKNPKAPFKVNVLNKQTVEVLGTHFNISAYLNDAEIKTTLIEGSVKVVSAKDNVLLKPGEMALNNLKNSPLEVIKVDTTEILGWKNGYFIFNNENLKPIMTKIARWYNVDVTIKGNVNDINIMGNYNRKKTLMTLLKGIELSNDVKFSVKERRVTIIRK